MMIRRDRSCDLPGCLNSESVATLSLWNQQVRLCDFHALDLSHRGFIVECDPGWYPS